MALSYRTKGDSTPQGKPRVYFSCHPLDFPVYFDVLYDDIQKTQNCAVWYKEDGSAPDEMELADLEQMQLFVLPVTTRLLTEPNRALEVEFPLAMTHHIPVLPILLESGLEELFNQKCGELQFLDKASSDPTAEPYSVKLEKYLSSVLVGDELAQKIREAFDAYIFLSYRKKDRRHAQELMRLIHQNDFCRDIAIWYDEYLTPGEDFNSAIADALNKSDLFALLVTPNLLEKGNYVAAHEYPAVKKTGKPVLPAEAIPTDRGALEEAYPAIPPCVDVHNAPALSASLLEAVKKLALQENDADPRHNFFIGLAYLSGIDVEVDREKGVALITGAAEAGLAEAAERLADMYRNGHGVGRNIVLSLQWLEKAAKLFAERANDSQSPKDFHRYFQVGYRLTKYMAELNDAKDPSGADALIGYAKSLAGHCENAIRLFGKSAPAYLWRDCAAIYTGLADLFLTAQKYDDAARYMEAALPISEELYAQLPSANKDAFRGLCFSRLGLGRAYATLRRYNDAKAILKKAIQGFSEHRGLIGLDPMEAEAYTTLAVVCSLQEDDAAAREYGKAGVALLTQIMAERENADIALRLTTAHHTLARIEEFSKNTDAAREALEAAIRIGEQTIELGHMPLAYQALANSHFALHELGARHGDIPLAGAHLLEWAQVYLNLAKELNSLAAWEKAVDCIYQVFLFEDKYGDPHVAAEHLDMAVDICVSALKSSPPEQTYPFKEWLAIFYHDIACMQDQPTARRELLESACALWGQLAQERPDRREDYLRMQAEMRDLISESDAPSSPAETQ